MRLTRSSQGFTLVEILVTLVILSSGFLGLAALQSTGIRQTLDIATYALANRQVNSLAERLRANPEIAQHYATAMTQGSCGVAPKSCASQACSGSELARYDHWETFCQQATGADSGITFPAFEQLDVSCQPTPCSAHSEYSIVLSWLAASTESLRNNSQPAQLQVQLIVRTQ